MADKHDMAIERLKAASEMSLSYYGEPLVVTDSGGKDSAVVKELARQAGIPFEVQHNHTTADAPETVRFIRQEAKRFEEMGIKYTINMPVYKGQRTSMWSLIPQKLMPPTRLVRYCCSVLKEQGGANRFITTGVRWAESTNRKNGRGIYERSHADKEKRVILNNDNDDKRMLFENCRMKGKRVVNPIVDWTDEDVWEFIRDSKISMNPLYAEGWCRAGCIGFPLAKRKGREAEFTRWPKYKQLYINAFDRMMEARTAYGKELWIGWNGVDVFNWWMEYDVLPGQVDILAEDYEEMTDDE